MKTLMVLLVMLISACSSKQALVESGETQVQIAKYDEYTIDERLNNIVFRVNSLEQGIYMIQKAVREAQDWDEDKKKAVCIAAGKTVRHENIHNMKVIMRSLEDEQQEMNADQQAAYHEFLRRISVFRPGTPLC